MNIMSLFQQAVGGTQAPATQQTQQTQQTPASGAGNPGNIPPNSNMNSTAGAGTDPNGVVPAGTANVAAASPLDAFSELWKNDPNAANPDAPYFAPDFASIQKAASAQDFSGAITAEDLQGIAQGGEAAVKAFASAMNRISQDVYARSAYAATKIAESGLTRAESRIKGSVPEIIRRSTVSESLRSENPAFSHPAAQPMIGAIQQQMATKYPNASAAELRTMATDYLTNFASLVNPPKDTTGTKTKANEPDWDSLLLG